MTAGRIPSVEGGIQPTLLTTKGDLISATAASTVARLAVGTDAQILVADSTASTGLKWAAAGPTFSGCRVQKAATQTLTSANTYYTITFDGTEDYDTAYYHSTVTNTSRITVPNTGYYLFTAQWNGNDSYIRDYMYLKNGATTMQKGWNAWTGTNLHGFGPSLVGQFYLTANDYIELQMSSVGSGSQVFGSTATGTFSTTMTCTYLGA